MSEDLILTVKCPDKPGITYAITGLLASVGGNIMESQQFNDAASGYFFVRIRARVPGGKATIEAAFAQLAANHQMTYQLSEADVPVRTLVMVTKDAHCLSDLLSKNREGLAPIDIVGVVGNHDTLKPLADFYNKRFIHIPISAETKEQAEDELLRLIEDEGVELVVLARYMQILSPRLCERLAGNVINIHHSFLPSFKGARPYHQAFLRGVKLIGATAHYVTSDLDEGPIIEQDVVRVAHDDDERELRAKGAEVERQVLSRAVKWHAEHRILMNGNRTVIFS
ncbi:MULTISPECIES: formyltetrahydrofolate deformylase [Trueperella]|uniref:Formyltetrahydrofolate deformylase n=1 Tax=Trueperella abortisuis TaxID=445930 RepID=A0ABT9PH25_9ACTO|nr:MULTISPECIES: formyltetrahydrofolate deformylase [Trueperella]MCI7306592.1 formyltetrahydrofolate deformylase [Trueperella sp.]MDP9832015.1 formyltetrahydrofolate deformylase [Trueperella abortisuis]MDY5402917.1 formyltetrahydrofolate deformylase [Trueperella sp.]